MRQKTACQICRVDLSRAEEVSLAAFNALVGGSQLAGGKRPAGGGEAAHDRRAEAIDLTNVRADSNFAPSFRHHHGYFSMRTTSGGYAHVNLCAASSVKAKNTATPRSAPTAAGVTPPQLEFTPADDRRLLTLYNETAHDKLRTVRLFGCEQQAAGADENAECRLDEAQFMHRLVYLLDLVACATSGGGGGGGAGGSSDGLRVHPPPPAPL